MRIGTLKEGYLTDAALFDSRTQKGWLVGLMAGEKRSANLFYQLLEIMGRPFVSVARVITPKVVLERHLPLVAFLLLLIVWLTVTAAKIQYCVLIGVRQCL